MNATAVRIETDEGSLVDERDIEIVERKGLGHPDSICDALMDRVSVELSRAYLQRCGAILHHNCDKGLLVAGKVERRFGGGQVLEPMRLVIADRAAALPGGSEPDVRDVAVEAARAWIREHLPFVDPERHVRYQVELRPGSRELTAIFAKHQAILGANDTSATVGYAPATETERLVLEAERFLNGPSFKRRFPSTGQDVKVMAVRGGSRLALTVAMPLLDRAVADETSYFDRREAVRDALLDHLRTLARRIDEIDLELNTLDRRGAGLDGVYVSVLGTSAEDADSGEVGRGNQVNGLIPFMRPRGAEAAAGKNPVSHVGKIYNVLGFRIAERIVERVEGVRHATIWLCSRIGRPIDLPMIASVRLALETGCAIEEVTSPVEEIVREELDRLPAFCAELAVGRHPIC